MVKLVPKRNLKSPKLSDPGVTIGVTQLRSEIISYANELEMSYLRGETSVNISDVVTRLRQIACINRPE